MIADPHPAGGFQPPMDQLGQQHGALQAIQKAPKVHQCFLLQVLTDPPGVGPGDCKRG